MTAFERTVTPLRWRTYLTAAGFHEKTALSLYLWNTAIGQSFHHFPLQVTEVALRNVVSHALCVTFGPNWWSESTCLAVLGPDRSDDILKVTTRIRRKYRSEPHGDQVVASLMFGFWSAMLKREYNRTLWDTCTVAAFPHGGEIGRVSRATSTIQDLRNRIFHHEPLIGRDLSGDYGTLIQLLGWICLETRDWVRANSSVPHVIRMRPRATPS